MMKGRNNGKKLMAVRIVAHAFEIVHLLTDQNPIQVLVDAIINTGPREDSTRIGSAGTVRRQAVDVSPLRRVNQAVSLLTIGTRESAFRNVKSISECLADELINAAKGSSNSYAIKKKDELERGQHTGLTRIRIHPLLLLTPLSPLFLLILPSRQVQPISSYPPLLVVVSWSEDVDTICFLRNEHTGPRVMRAVSCRVLDELRAFRTPGPVLSDREA